MDLIREAGVPLEYTRTVYLIQMFVRDCPDCLHSLRAPVVKRGTAARHGTAAGSARYLGLLA